MVGKKSQIQKEPVKLLAEVVPDPKKRHFLIRAWPYIAVALAHIIWGANFVVAKITLQEFPPMSLAFIRFFLAFFLILPFYLTGHSKTKISFSDLPSLTLAGLLMVSLNIAFFYLGLVKTTAADASVLTMVIPVLAVIFAWWFLREKIYTINLVGIIVGLLGTVFIIGAPFLLLGYDLSWEKLIGDLLIIISSIAWVLGAVISKKALKKHSTLTITTFIFLVGALSFALPAAQEYLKNPLWPTHLTYIGIVGAAYIAILSSICAYFLFEWGLLTLGVIKADLFQYIEPLVATTVAVFVLNEYIRVHFIIGAILIGLGVYLGTLGKPEYKHHKAHRR